MIVDRKLFNVWCHFTVRKHRLCVNVRRVKKLSKVLAVERWLFQSFVYKKPDVSGYVAVLVSETVRPRNYPVDMNIYI